MVYVITSLSSIWSNFTVHGENTKNVDNDPLRIQLTEV